MASLILILAALTVLAGAFTVAAYTVIRLLWHGVKDARRSHQRHRTSSRTHRS